VAQARHGFFSGAAFTHADSRSRFAHADYQSGFGLLSIATNAPTSVIDAIASIDVLNAGTPVIIAIVGFGVTLCLIEGRANKQFNALDNGVYFAFVGACSRLRACLLPPRP
jgi:hypothetical protein